MFSATTKEAANITKDFAVSDIKNAAGTAKRDARQATDGVVDDLSNYAEQAGRKVRNMIDTASDTFTDTTKQVTHHIEENPVRSTMIALGVGFVIGALFRR